jgi:hypothetical protein
MKTFISPASLLLGLALLLIPSIASAQSNSNEGGDPFKRAATGDTSGLLNLINQAQINGKINPNAIAEQREQIDSATKDFQTLRLQMLRDRQKKAATDPATVAPIVSPK